jgi:hypothetical protein
MPRPVQIFSIEATDGCNCFRNQVEIVDWAMPEFLAREYSVQFLLSLSRSIFPKTSKCGFSWAIAFLHQKTGTEIMPLPLTA